MLPQATNFSFTSQIDVGFFRPEWKQWNKGYLAYCALSTEYGYIEAIPMKDTKREAFEEVIELLVKQSGLPRIDCLQADGEASLTSEKFKDKMKATYGIEIQRLSQHCKAFR